MISDNLDNLRILQTEVQTELVRSKLNVDRLMLRQQHGFMSVMPSGRNMFREQFERVLPASSVANLYPFSFSGKTDENGFYLGRDKFGSNIIVDFDKRSDDKTNANTLILGNSGQGKSYLLKLILTNLRESGKNIICLDPEMEYVDLTKNLGGCFIDLMSGEYIINVLEPKSWGDEAADDDAPRAFKSKTKLSQHISFLRDFFRSYKDFSDREIDTIELLLIKLYEKFGISDNTDWNAMKPTDFPILSDFYELIGAEYKSFNPKEKGLYTAENLQNICLGLHSICVGAESKFFNGYTNITDSRFITFGVKGLLQASKNIRNALLFNVLAYMSEQLLSRGNTVASIDEFYLFLTNLTAVEYIRNFMKRVRKKESAVILASQNIEDFLVENVRELTKPLFSIPTHIFLFYPGTIEKKTYMDAMKWLEFFGLENLRNEKAKNLPYGYQRELEIARALATEPRLLFLDEPAAGMNPQETEDLMKTIRRIRDIGVTVVLIEHDMKLVMNICDNITVLNYGQKIAQGTAQEIQSNPAVIEAYLGKDEDEEDDEE